MVTLIRRERHSVSDLLTELEIAPGAPAETRNNAEYWAVSLTRQMNKDSLQTVVRLLLAVSNTPGIDMSQRRRARQWAAYLGAKI